MYLTCRLQYELLEERAEPQEKTGRPYENTSLIDVLLLENPAKTHTSTAATAALISFLFPFTFRLFFIYSLVVIYIYDAS
jgi:hypothetical protein